jgi:hypothetical protein
MTITSPRRQQHGTANGRGRRSSHSDARPDQGARVRHVTDAVVAGYIRDISVRERRGLGHRTPNRSSLAPL